MRRQIVVLSLCAALSGCGVIGSLAPTATAVAPPDTSDGQTRPVSRPDGVNTSVPAPSETARTVEEFDTTTAAEREAAAVVDVGGETRVGTTIVSLGDPARPGFWIETPLVSASGSGRVRFPDTGQSSQVDLIPIDGPPTAGSRMSLAAMRLIGAPLTGLVEVEVFSGG